MSKTLNSLVELLTPVTSKFGGRNTGWYNTMHNGNMFGGRDETATFKMLNEQFVEHGGITITQNGDRYGNPTVEHTDIAVVRGVLVTMFSVADTAETRSAVSTFGEVLEVLAGQNFIVGNISFSLTTGGPQLRASFTNGFVSVDLKYENVPTQFKVGELFPGVNYIIGAGVPYVFADEYSGGGDNTILLPTSEGGYKPLARVTAYHDSRSIKNDSVISREQVLQLLSTIMDTDRQAQVFRIVELVLNNLADKPTPVLFDVRMALHSNNESKSVTLSYMCNDKVWNVVAYA